MKEYTFTRLYTASNGHIFKVMIECTNITITPSLEPLTDPEKYIGTEWSVDIYNHKDKIVTIDDSKYPDFTEWLGDVIKELEDEVVALELNILEGDSIGITEDKILDP